MPTGEPTSTTLGTTSDFQQNRDRIIYRATLKVGGIEQGGTLSADQLADGAAALNLIVRQLDVREKNLWAISPDATHLTLTADTARYTLTGNVLELVTAYYRDEQNEDHKLKILTTEEYEAVKNKLERGDPRAVYLQNTGIVSSKTLFVHPVRASVNTQSVVTGTDATVYRCIRSHTASSDNRPVTGGDYRQYWEAGGSGPAVWASGTQYLAPQQIRYTFKRPLYDFDLSTDRPDFPQALSRYLIYALAYDLADDYGRSNEEILKLKGKKDEAYLEAFPGVHVPKSNNIYNKSRDF